MKGVDARGFTLIELMVAVAIVAILASIALPSYTEHVRRARVPPALEALSSYQTRMEQHFQDVGSYEREGACGVALPTAAHFTIGCVVTSGGTGFVVTATGSGAMAGYAYTIDQRGTRRTTSHPRSVPAADCWSTKGSVCDDA